MFAALTSLIAFQIVFNLTGAIELGGKYMGWTMLLYSMGSLAPGLALGWYAAKVTHARSLERRTNLLSRSCVFVIIARIYVGAFALVTILLPLSGYIASTTD